MHCAKCAQQIVCSNHEATALSLVKGQTPLGNRRCIRAFRRRSERS